MQTNSLILEKQVSPWIGTAIVIAVLILLVVLAVKKLYKMKKSKGNICASCPANGNCAACPSQQEYMDKLKEEKPELYAKLKQAEAEYNQKNKEISN